MFGLLNSSQIYGLQQTHEKSNAATATTATPITNHKTRRTSSNASDTGKESKFLATLSSASQGMKSPTNFIEKFIKSELLSGYDTIKNYKNFHHSTKPGGPSHHGSSPHNAGVIPSFSCLQGSYRSNADGEFYEAINVAANAGVENGQAQGYQKLSDSEIDLPPSLLTSSGASSGEFNSDTTANNITNSNNNNGSSSGTSGNNLFKKMHMGAKVLKNLDLINGNANEIPSDNSSSSISTTTTNSSTTSSHNTSTKSNDLQRSSSSASSNIARPPTGSKKVASTATTHRTSPEKSQNKNAAATAMATPTSNSRMGGVGGVASTERSQRRKLMQMISNYDQQNKLLQRELAKEKRRRTEELACVVKSLICFESKLKTDMKSVNQRLQEKDAEICRLVRQNRALRKQLQHAKDIEVENAKDEGVGEEDSSSLPDVEAEGDDGGAIERRKKQMPQRNVAKVLEEDLDCLVLEALQCNNCRKQFYDIDLKESWTQTGKDGSRQNDDHTTELGSSSDDTVSSSFYGARRSVRYTSKRTSGTFRDYMRSRSMHIDDEDYDQHLDNNSEGNTSTISRNDSQRSYEKMNIYSRTMERMHGVKAGSDDNGGNSNGDIAAAQDAVRSASRASNKSTASSKSSGSNKSISAVLIEEDDGIFSPTQDEDFEEDDDDVADNDDQHKIIKRRSMEFSEASPKQVYETSTDDWYASASDQEESSTAPKSYGQNAVNPVLECVNQILLQQSMEEPTSSPTIRTPLESTPKSAHHLSVGANTATSNLPRRSSLSGRRSSRSNSHSSEGGEGQTPRNGTLTRKRVHFSTKNSMVHVPRHDDHEDDDDDYDCDEAARNITVDALLPPPSLVQLYHPMNYLKVQTTSSKQAAGTATASSLPNTVIYTAAAIAVQQREENERLDILNYESIYSNEYEPIGSEHNSSNLYVDMESTLKLPVESRLEAKLHKLPPALPPKPANLLKFKKSLQQLDEMPDEHLQQDDCDASTTTISEPDYCSISEVNMGGGMRSVQIVADVHKPPESEPDLEEQTINTERVEMELEVSTIASVRSDDTCGAESHKTEEIEEIFADIPKLPNVAAIIAPKNSPKFMPQQQNDHYLLMSPKVEKSSAAALMKHKLSLNLADISNNSNNDYLISSPRMQKSPKVEITPLSLQFGSGADASTTRQYKRKHVPNILAEINKRMHNTAVPPNSPSTPTSKVMLPSPKPKPSSQLMNSPQTGEPLFHAEFDWYNLDAEYGKSPSHAAKIGSLQHTPDILKVTDNLGSAVVVPTLLEEIHEDHESIVSTADEYNLDEEFSLTSDKPDLVLGEVEMCSLEDDNHCKTETYMSAICEAVNFPLFSESSPQGSATSASTKVNNKKMKKNLANFEKFIEGSGLSTKTLPSKRKIYFAGPFV